MQLICPYCWQSKEGNGKDGETGCDGLSDPGLWYFVSVSYGRHGHLRDKEWGLTPNVSKCKS